MGKHVFRVITGLILVFVGMDFLMDRMGLEGPWGLGIVDFWPLIVMAVGAVMLFRRGPGTKAGLILLLLGGAFMASEIFGWNIWSVGWPLVLVVVGLWILLRGPLGFASATSGTTDEGVLHENVIFQGMEKRVLSGSFTGGSVNCTLGGFKLDLRGARLAPQGAVLRVSCSFGGGEILIPPGIRVSSEGSATFGGWNNRFEAHATPDAPLLRIEGSVVFGGIDISN